MKATKEEKKETKKRKKIKKKKETNWKLPLNYSPVFCQSLMLYSKHRMQAGAWRETNTCRRIVCFVVLALDEGVDDLIKPRDRASNQN